MSEPIYIELAVRQCESGTASATAQKAVAARFRERTSKLAKATERIVALGNEIARLREERRWVPVEERLPPDNVAVLCWVDGCGAEMVWREKGQWFLSFAGYPISDSTYTHWQTLPAGPDVKEANRE